MPLDRLKETPTNLETFLLAKWDKRQVDLNGKTQQDKFNFFRCHVKFVQLSYVLQNNGSHDSLSLLFCQPRLNKFLKAVVTGYP